MRRVLKALLAAMLPVAGVLAKGLPPVGVTSSGGYYAFDASTSCVEEGADRILGMGAKVIKLWLSDQSMRVNPYHTDWSRYEIRDCIDILRSDYYKAALAKEFEAVVLVTHTFDTRCENANVVWWDGMTPAECRRVEQEMYDVAAYLLTAYRGSGKTFVLQNWEGDNMIGSNGWRFDAQYDRFYRPGHEAQAVEDDRVYRVREEGLREWFNARQRGVDRAVVDGNGRTDVVVRHALEVNFTYLDASDAPYPYADSPILIRRIVPYTDCDLYSYSCWSAGVLSRAWTMKERLEQVFAAIGDTYVDPVDGTVRARRPLGPRQRSRLMLGEYGGPERYQGSDSGSWAPELTRGTDRTQRKVIQIQSAQALACGVEYVLFWEIYCNVPRVDTTPAVEIDSRHGEQAVSNDQMQGSWLVRADGSFTEGYLYLRGLLGQGLWADMKYRSGKTCRTGGPCGGIELHLSVEGYPPYLDAQAAEEAGARIRLEGSADGKRFESVAADAFIAVRDDQGELLVVLSDDPLPAAWRFVRASFDPAVFRDARIVLHKPNDQTLQKR